MRLALGLLLVASCALLWSTSASAGNVPMNAFKRPGDLSLEFPRLTSAVDWPPAAMTHPVGDVNGDGRIDIAMSISDGSTGTTWVTFNPAAQSQTLAVTAATWPGLRIDTPRSVTGIAGVGDINHDGFGDVAVATTTAVHVVFGRATPEHIDVEQLGTRGFTLAAITPCAADGSGNTYTGIFSRRTSVAGIEGGLAICTFDAILVFYPPGDAAGQTFDLHVPRPDTGRLALPAGAYPAGFGAHPDGRIVVGWVSGATARILTLPPPAAGETTNTTTAQAAPETATLDIAASQLEQVTPMRDANGDGRPDLALSLVDQLHRRRFVSFTPAPGQHETLQAANSLSAEDSASGLTDVGDQDGDGRPDIAYDSEVKLSGGGSMSIDQSLPTCAPLNALSSSATLMLCSLEYKIADSLPDMNADGKPEMIAIYADPLPIQVGTSNTTWHLDVFLSAPLPTVAGLELPVQDGFGITFAGTFNTAPSGPIRTLGARGTVSITDAAGRDHTFDGDIVDASATTTRVQVRALSMLLGLIPGRTYTYRFALENGRGLKATAPPGTFIARQALTAKPQSRRGKKLTGTRRADRLVGTSLDDELIGRGGNDTLIGNRGNDLLDGGTGRDKLRGNAGDDTLTGGRGNDILDGGPGHDVLRGGAGNDQLRAVDGKRDVVDCGSGHDRATIDRRDKVKHCEKVIRRRT